MHVVLVEPQIPQNTGSIARTCAALKTPLHIIGPTPFEIDEKKVRRAGLDYWPLVTLFEYSSWDDFIGKVSPKRLWYLSTKGTTPYYRAQFNQDDFLVFGSETKGLGKEFLNRVELSELLTIPMEEPGVRSLNLSNAVSIVLYDAYRQTCGHLLG